MNLDKLNIEDVNDKGVVFTPYHPVSYEKLDIEITAFGAQSRAFKKAQRELAKNKAKYKTT